MSCMIQVFLLKNAEKLFLTRYLSVEVLKTDNHFQKYKHNFLPFFFFTKLPNTLAKSASGKRQY